MRRKISPRERSLYFYRNHLIQREQASAPFEQKVIIHATPWHLDALDNGNALLVTEWCLLKSSTSIKRKITSYLGYFDFTFTFRLRSRFRLNLDLGHLDHKSDWANTTKIGGGEVQSVIVTSLIWFFCVLQESNQWQCWATRPTMFRPYPRRLERLTNIRCERKAAHSPQGF